MSDGLKRRVAIALVAAASVIASEAAPAQAAEFDVWSCRGPSGQPVSTGAWQQFAEMAAPGDVVFTDTCDTGGALTVALTDSAIPSGRSPKGALNFHLSDGLYIAGYELQRYIGVPPALLPTRYRAGITETRPWTTLHFGCASAPTTAPGFQVCPELGDSSDPDHIDNLYQGAGLWKTGLSLWAECRSDGCAPVATSPSPATFRLYRSKVTVRDHFSPDPPILSGTIISSDSVSGRANLLVESTDKGSGIRSFSLSVDGGPAIVLPARDPNGTCQSPFDRPQPCRLSAARLFEIDTDPLAEGLHGLAGTITDASGNATSFGPIPFRVDHRRSDGPGGSGGNGGSGGHGEDGSAGSGSPHGKGDSALAEDLSPSNGSPAVIFPRIELARQAVTHPARRRAQLQGRLLTDTGAPIADARLNVVMDVQRLGMPRHRQLPEVRTGADGGFRIPVPGGGRRTVTISFAPDPDRPPTRMARAEVTSKLVISVRRRPARVRTGGRFALTGRLLGGGETAKGANIEIQSIVSGRWRTVANVPVRAGGRFAWRYRFRYVNRDALFSFRAVVRRTPGWPWSTQRSGRVTVRIDGG